MSVLVAKLDGVSPIERHHSSASPGLQRLLTCSSPSSAMAGERDEAAKQAEELRSLLHMPGCSSVCVLSLLRASLYGLRVKIVGILGTVAILLTEGRGSSLVFIFLKVRYE